MTYQAFRVNLENQKKQKGGIEILTVNWSEKINALLHPSDLEIAHAIGITLFILGFSRLLILFIYGITGNKEARNAKEAWDSLTMIFAGAAIMLISENMMRA